MRCKRCHTWNSATRRWHSHHKKRAMASTRYPTWILIADGKNARVLMREAHNSPLTVARELHGADATHARDLKTGPTGRFGSGRLEPRTDPLVHEKQQFARRLAELMNTAAREKLFRRLVLVAPPKTLGDLRMSLDGAASRLVSAEIPHDHVHTPPAELLQHLGDAL
jgi:protein required for attachment to host cells